MPYKTGTIVQYTTAGGAVKMGEYIKDTPSEPISDALSPISK